MKFLPTINVSGGESGGGAIQAQQGPTREQSINPPDLQQVARGEAVPTVDGGAGVVEVMNVGAAPAVAAVLQGDIPGAAVGEGAVLGGDGINVDQPNAILDDANPPAILEAVLGAPEPLLAQPDTGA